MVPSDVHDQILCAIRDRRLIAFDYKGTARRVVEPHDYGLKGHSECLLGYQISGQSRSGTAHGWKMFDVEAIGNLRLLDRTFAGSRGAASEHHLHWDQLFARVDSVTT
jgi:hypothetical protein